MGGSQGVSAPCELYRFVLRATSPQAQAILFALESLELQFEHAPPSLPEQPLHAFTLYASGTEEREAMNRALSGLPASGFLVEPYAYDRFEWVEKWKESFYWAQLSARLAVGPDFRPCAFQVPVALAITPGQTFGTGVHETTRIALRLMDTYIQPGQTVCDAGCGTGILAIAARKLGAESATGFDISPDSESECADNAARNGTEFLFVKGDGADIQASFDLVVANMLAHELLPMSHRLQKLVKPGGILLLTGLIEENFNTFEYHFFDLPLPEKPNGWKSPTLRDELPFIVLEKRWENEWWGGAWRRRP